jgi:hypothetical protein
VLVTGRRLKPLEETASLAAGLSGIIECYQCDIVERDHTVLVERALSMGGGKLDILVGTALSAPVRSGHLVKSDLA